MHNVVDRRVLQAMWEELTGNVGHRDNINSLSANNDAYLKTLYIRFRSGAVLAMLYHSICFCLSRRNKIAIMKVNENRNTRRAQTCVKSEFV